MTGQTMVQLFNQVFENNYNELKLFSRDDDLLHRSYINVIERLERGVIKTGNTITEANKLIVNYCKKTIVNQRKRNWKDKKNIESITEPTKLYQADNRLVMLEELLEDDKIMENQVNVVMKNLWIYLERHHQPYEIYIFKVYYFSGRKLTYRDISMLHNIKPWAIDKILKGLRKSIRENLITYMEDREKFERVEAFIKKGGIPREMFHVAVDLFRDCFPEKHGELCMGCQGKSIRIMYANFRTYHKINKHKYEN